MTTPVLKAPPRLSGRAVLLLLWVFALGVLLAFREVLLPFAVAALLAYLLEPVVSRIASIEIGARRLPRWIGVIICYLAFAFLLYLFLLMAIPQLYKEFARLSADAREFVKELTPDKMSRYAQQLEDWLLSHGIPLELGGDETPVAADGHFSLRFDLERALREAGAKLNEGVREHFIDAVGVGQRLVGNVLGGVFRFFFILMVTAFLLIDARRIQTFVRNMVPRDRHADFNSLLAEIDKRLGGVVRGQFVICLVNGTLTFIGMVILGVKFAFVLSIMAMTLSLLPIFGTIISSVPIVLIGLSQGLHTGALALAWIVGIHALEAYFLNPKIMGSHAQIHPVIVAFSLLAGEHVFGLAGAIFAVPLAAMVVATFMFAHGKATEEDAPVATVEPTPGAS